MKLNLKRPLIIFDLETTGLDLVRDRIIQLSFIKVYPDGREERGNYLVNPEQHVLPVITELTGISDDDLKDKPTFKQLSSELSGIFEGCDFAGFNSNHFDIPLLAEEFLRVGVDFDFSRCHLIDAQSIFHKMERRNLAAAYKFYCGRNMEDDFKAHRADQDAEATYRVLCGELDKYAPGAQEEPDKVLVNDMEYLAEFSKTNKNVDFAGRIVWGEKKDKAGNVVVGDDGKPVMIEYFNFGKHKGKPVADVLRHDPGYFSWILSGDFTYNTKQVLVRIKLKEAAKKV